jgi:2-polyprenyl-3-methyl-5-hydroxy-6-metoxy-1,4-benzoquinol methylase
MKNIFYYMKGFFNRNFEKINKLETQLNSIESSLIFGIKEEVQKLDNFQANEINKRLQTIEWLVTNNRYDISYIIQSINSVKLDFDLNYLKENGINQEFTLVSNNKLAFSSNDFKEPESTMEGMRDSSWFIYEVEKLIGKNKISFMDIGCGSGALSFQFLKKGHFSIGLDGSDFCKNNQLGYWSYNDLLKTCDVTKPFHILREDEMVNFDIITMWEVFEHIFEQDIDSVLNNIVDNLNDDGFFIGSISTLEYLNPKTGVIYHVTLKEYEWWEKKFHNSGLTMIALPIPAFSCCRGVGDRYQDPHSYIDAPETGFHFCAIKSRKK